MQFVAATFVIGALLTGGAIAEPASDKHKHEQSSWLDDASKQHSHDKKDNHSQSDSHQHDAEKAKKQ